MESIALSNKANFVNKLGQTFGRLTVVKYLGKIRNNKRHYWECLCECGKISQVASGELNNKPRGAKSCGCLKVEKTIERSTTHGQTNTISYTSYRAAKERCSNPNHKDYLNNGGRGIKFMINNFEDLINSIGERPSKEFSLDRIDTNGHYKLGNVRWATCKEQGNNTRVNRYLTVNNVTKTLAEWTGGKSTLEYSRVKSRIYRGWCDECALTKNYCEHKKKFIGYFSYLWTCHLLL